MAFVGYEKKDFVGYITLQRPEALNALNNAILTELDGRLNQLNETQDIRALIVTGAGEKAFVAGADIHDSNRGHHNPSAVHE